MAGTSHKNIGFFMGPEIKIPLYNIKTCTLKCILKFDSAPINLFRQNQLR